MITTKALPLVFILAMSAAATAAQYDWNGGAGDLDWYSAGNWSTDSASWTYPSEQFGNYYTNEDAASINIANGDAVNASGTLGFTSMSLGALADGSNVAHISLDNGSALSVDGTLWMSDSSGTNSRITLNNGSALTVGSELQVGNDGPGFAEVFVNDSMLVSTSHLVVGERQNTDGYLEINGAGSTVSTSGNLYMIDSNGASGAALSQVVMNDGLLDIGGNIYVNDDGDEAGNQALFTLNGGSVQAGGWMALPWVMSVDQSHMTVNDGSLVLADARGIEMGVSGADTVESRLFMNGGLVQAEALTFTAADSQVVFTGGELRVNSTALDVDGMLALIGDKIDVSGAPAWNVSTDGDYTVLGVPDPDAPILTLEIDQVNGGITVSNESTFAVPIRGYSILSNGETLNPENWTSIADGGDADSGGSIDPDDNWIEFTNPGSHGDLSEGSLGEGGFDPGVSFSLGVGAWSQYYRQDLRFQYINGNGEVVNGITVYTGNDGNPYVFGDLNFDGGVDEADWLQYVAALNGEFPDASIAEAYVMGDLNADLVNNYFDFLEFMGAFDAVNGAGAFDRMINAPEPAAGLMAIFGMLLVSLRYRRSMNLQRVLLVAVPLCVCLSAGTTMAQPSPSDGVIYYLPLDANAMDQSGNGVATSINSVVTFNGAGVVGNAAGIFNADGVTSTTASYIVTDNELSLGTSDFSVSVWVKGDDTFSVNETDGTIMSNKDWNSGSNVGWVIARGTATGGGGWQWNFDTDVAGRADFDPSPTVSLIEDNQWHHIAVSHDRDGEAVFFFDGQQIGSADISAHATGSIDAGLPTGVGVDGALGDPWAAFINGSIDDVAMWNRVVTPGEMSDIYEAGLAGIGLQDVPGPMVLRVNTTTGATSIVRDHPQLLVDANYYEVNSPSGSLDVNGWNSLDDQNIGFGSGIGENWDEGGLSGSEKVSEAFLLGSTVFGSHSIGNLYVPSVQEAQDLTFFYGKTNGTLVQGFVDYVSGAVCDIDGDGTCGPDDIDRLYDDIAAGTSGGPSDIDGNGTVDNADITAWLADASATNGKVYLPGDTNLDGEVGGPDFTTLALNFGHSGADPAAVDAYWRHGNFDGNGTSGLFEVGGPDFTGLALNFGHVSVNAVPEPAANWGFALLVSHAVLALRRSRR